MNTRNLHIRASSGFSIVDVMVGMVIALIGTIVIFQVFAVSEGQKRTTTGGGEAQQNASMVLIALERSIKEAGYGFNSADTSHAVELSFGAAASSDSIVVTSRPGWDYGPFSPDPVVFPSAVPPAPTLETFSVNGSAQLVSTISGVAGATVLSDGIVQMKALYGTDSNGDGTVSVGEWGTAVPADFKTVLAVAVGLVSRSAQPEGKDRTACTTTTSAPSWMAINFDLTGNVGLAPGDDWKCYRYKTFGVIVPLRNLLWKP